MRDARPATRDPIDDLSADEALAVIDTRDAEPRARTAPPESSLPEPVRLLDAPTTCAVGWLADGFLLDREPTLLVGRGGAFKSTIALSIAAAVAGGYNVLGRFRVATPGPVLLVSEEDSLDLIHDRIEALVAGMGWDHDRVLGNLHTFALNGVRLDDLQWRLHLRHHAERIGARLVVLDPLADMLGAGSERSPDDARVVVELWRWLAADGRAVLVVHHITKPRDGYSALDAVRGAGSWANAARGVFTLEERDGSLFIGCEKLNRAPRVPSFEVEVAIEADPANAATWRSARVETQGGAGDWRLTDQRRLTLSEQKVLAALDRHPHELLSWSKWLGVSGVSSTTLSEVIPRLLALGFIVRERTGMRAGKAVFAYSITGPGVAALIPEEPPTPRLRPDSASTPSESADSRLRDSAPPCGNKGDKSGGVDGNPESDSESGPGLEPDSEAYWRGLVEDPAGGS